MANYIVDEVMGSGKTTAAINLINEYSRWIYVTPYRSELERVGIDTPEGDILITDLRRLLHAGKSVVITHALFQLFDDDIRDMIAEKEYSLIMDETAEVLSPVELGECDQEILWKLFLSGEPGSPVRWNNEPEYSGVFSYIKRAADRGVLHCFNDRSLVQMYPIDIYLAFKDIYILTYQFDWQLQKYYFDYYGIKFEHLYVTPDYHLTKEPHPDTEDFKDLINIVDDFGNYPGQFDLSKSWYQRASSDDLERLKRNAENFFWNKPTVWDGEAGVFQRAKSRDALWTTFTDYRRILSGKGYSKGFAPCNMRASNEFGDRHAVAYLVNRFMNPNIKNFFLVAGIRVDEDGFALSEMLQFIWRSAIRNGEQISVYIPSERMRKLLLDKYDIRC